MEDADVRSALTAYVTEDEPPIGLSGEAVLAAARASRRRQLTTGVVAAVVVVLALGLAIVVLPRQSEPAGPTCPSASPSETRGQIIDRLSCVISRAVRSLLPADTRFERLTIPGETPPADPFHLIGDEMGTSPREAFFHLGVRVTDSRGTGSVYVLMMPAENAGFSRCSPPNPGELTCAEEQLPQGGLRLVSDRLSGAFSYRATLAGPDARVQFWSNNSGVLEQKDVRLPEQRPEPLLSAAQVRQLALTPGLGL
jgi:hypothetical protein